MNKAPKKVDIKMRAVISATIQAYLTEIETTAITKPTEKINGWKLFTTTDYNRLRIAKTNPWKNHTGFYD